MAEGDLETAQNRYERWLAMDPRASLAHVGLARVALARGSKEDAEDHYRRAIAIDARTVEAWMGLADLVSGDRRRAVPYLEKALEIQPLHPGANAALATLTGRARNRARTLPEALKLAGLHPYDPVALLDAGELLARAGRESEAVPTLEAVVALADLDPGAAKRALALLPEVSRDWRDRRVVAVEVHADSGARAWRGWRFRQRSMWAQLSRALEPALGTRFVVMRMAEFEDAPEGMPLDTLLNVVAARTSGAPDGIVAAFRGEATPRRAGGKRGVAHYLGRHLIVRDVPGEATAQTLAHELLHLYGGVHVLDDLSSLMNPSGTSRDVDALNARIAQIMAPRTFGAAGVERDVLAHIDLADAAAAFREALRVNLTFRRMGMDALLGEAKQIGPRAARELEQQTQIDEHLADVARFTSRLFWETEERVQSIVMLEAAAQLYGPRSTRGRMATVQANRLRARLSKEYGIN